MATDNLNYYSAGLPAGQQTDRYSSQPGCLRSKNLDIFSSSKSVKATAWSEPTESGADIIKQDGDLILKTDGKVYNVSTGTEVLVVDPSVNFPVYQVSYNGSNGTYEAAQWGTPQDMVAKYEGDELKAFTVFTDRASYTWSAVKYVPKKSFTSLSNLTYDTDSPFTDGYLFTKSNTSSATAQLDIIIEDAPFTKIPIKIYAKEYNSDNTNISIDHIWVTPPVGYYYDAELDGMTPQSTLGADIDIPYTGNITDGILVEVPVFPSYNGRRQIRIKFKFTKKDESGNYGWANGELFIDINGGETERHRMKINGANSDGDYNEYYSYLPIRDRELIETGEYYWMKGLSFQPLYNRSGTWADVNGEKKVRYDLVQYMGWVSDVSMDVIGMIAWNEQIYMIGNMNGNGYIIPCDLTGGRGTPYIAYGCEFKGVTNIDYLMYLVGEDRGVSQLWVYNGQELVSIIGGNRESNLVDIIGVDEQYKFDGRMVEYRGNLVLTTSDNRVFEYGQTYGGKGGAFILELPTDWDITGLRVKGNDLLLDYSATEFGVTYNLTITYQDDTPYKVYNDTWEAVYPIVIGNHLLEKEESDLYASYILPSSECSLEFWGCANHYHFWTFKSEQSETLSTEVNYKLKGATGNYKLKFIEKNGGRYTFRLEGDLPVQTGGWKIITNSTGGEILPYTEFNHFRKIGEITADGYTEGEIRFHNLNNKLELPKSHSLQVMVRGYGTTTATPELFALDLVANQRERG